jgi:hypothetical protein
MAAGSASITEPQYEALKRAVHGCGCVVVHHARARALRRMGLVTTHGGGVEIRPTRAGRELVAEHEARAEREQRIGERGIVLQVLRDDHPERWTRAELEQECSDLDPRAFREGLATLEAEGVVELDGEGVRASLCTQHLDLLEMIAP